MVNQTGIAIVVKAFLPTGKTLDEQFAALSIVKTAHESGDYAELLKHAMIDEVKTEQKTRRVEEPALATTEAEPKAEQDLDGGEFAEGTVAEPTPAVEANDDAAVPTFLKGKKKAA
jgi:hypothetical protein